MCDIVAKRTTLVLRWINREYRVEVKKLHVFLIAVGPVLQGLEGLEMEGDGIEGGLRVKDLNNSIYLV